MNANCGLSFEFPAYPSTTRARSVVNGEPTGSAGSISEITANGWWDWEDVNPTGVCSRRLRKTTIRQQHGQEYATEHIYEKHIVKMFLNWLSFDMTEDNGGFDAGRVTDCTTMKKLFGSKSSDASSSFYSVTPAQKLANQVTCFGTNCPDNSRVSEFFILEASVNGLKENILGEMRKDADFKLLTCDKTGWRENLSKLATISAAFQYISTDKVAAVFIQVNDRMRAVLGELDGDPFYSQYKPGPQNVPGDPDGIRHNGWLGAYDYFMRMFLDGAQEKSRQFVHSCAPKVIEGIKADSLTNDEESRQIARIEANLNLAGGMWQDSTMSFGSGYASLMTKEWS